MIALSVDVLGIGLWSARLGDFAALRQWLAGDPVEPPAARPAARVLPPNERRRAPDSVLMAVEAAGQAVATSGLEAATLACVFASSHGDQTITDYMCATLAEAPAELSPTRFHNSVHNAPAGYWTIATGCHAPSSAVCAHAASFGAGLLEAAVTATADARPVLLVCSDTAGSGPLQEVTGCAAPFASALVLAPAGTGACLARLGLHLQSGSVEPTPPPAPVPAAWIAENPSAAALPLLALLARDGGRCTLRAAAALGMEVLVEHCK